MNYKDIYDIKDKDLKTKNNKVKKCYFLLFHSSKFIRRDKNDFLEEDREEFLGCLKNLKDINFKLDKHFKDLLKYYDIINNNDNYKESKRYKKLIYDLYLNIDNLIILINFLKDIFNIEVELKKNIKKHLITHRNYFKSLSKKVEL